MRMHFRRHAPADFPRPQAPKHASRTRWRRLVVSAVAKPSRNSPPVALKQMSSVSAVVGRAKRSMKRTPMDGHTAMHSLPWVCNSEPHWWTVYKKDNRWPRTYLLVGATVMTEAPPRPCAGQECAYRHAKKCLALGGRSQVAASPGPRKQAPTQPRRIADDAWHAHLCAEDQDASGRQRPLWANMWQNETWSRRHMVAGLKPATQAT